MPQKNSATPEPTSGSIMRASRRYSPGAMKRQSCSST